jgi:hypothetical protein
LSVGHFIDELPPAPFVAGLCELLGHLPELSPIFQTLGRCCSSGTVLMTVLPPTFLEMTQPP